MSETMPYNGPENLVATATEITMLADAVCDVDSESQFAREQQAIAANVRLNALRNSFWKATEHLDDEKTIHFSKALQNALRDSEVVVEESSDEGAYTLLEESLCDLVNAFNGDWEADSVEPVEDSCEVTQKILNKHEQHRMVASMETSQHRTAGD